MSNDEIPREEGLKEGQPATDLIEREMEGRPTSVRQLFHDIRGNLSVCVSGIRILKRKVDRGITPESAAELEDILVQVERSLYSGLAELTKLHDRVGSSS